MRVAVAWAGGIGSMLALEDALRVPGHDVTLVHAVTERTASEFVIEDQAAALGLPLRLARPGANGDEIGALADALRDAKVERVSFGYLRGEENAGMFTLARAARDAHAEPHIPARHIRPDDAARQLADAGHRAFVHRVISPVPPAWLGRFLDDAATIDAFEGEFGRVGWTSIRTLVVAGPRFVRPLDVTAGDVEPTPEGGWRLPLAVRGC